MNATLYLAEVAAALADTGVDVVFIGGATIPLYLDAAGAAAARATEDIDCIVNCLTLVDYNEVEAKMRRGGFESCMDEDAPICRWVLQHEGVRVLVDVMPVSDLLGFGNRFYKGAVATSQLFQLGTRTIRIPTAGYAFATKVAAWQGRGNNDPWGSKDFEDLIALADGCRHLHDSYFALPVDVREDLAAELRRLLAMPDFRSYVQGLVPPPATTGAIENCLTVLQKLAVGRAG